MDIGPAMRRSLRRFETPAAAAYRSLFFNVDHFGELSLILAPRATRILEIGCGDGAVADRITAAYPRAEYIGIDVAPEPGRRYTGDLARASFKSCFSSDLRATDPEPFDLILVVDVLHHVPSNEDRVALIADAAAMLALDGTILVKEWERTGGLAYNAGWVAGRFVSGDQQVRYMVRGELLDLIRQGAPDLHHVHPTTVRPWRCNVVHALRTTP